MDDFFVVYCSTTIILRRMCCAFFVGHCDFACDRRSLSLPRSEAKPDFSGNLLDLSV